MNKKLICLLMFVFSLSLAFTACSDDDDDKVDYAKEVAGTYTGSLTLKIPVMEIDETIADKKIELTRISDNKVNLKLKEFSYGTLTLGDIPVDEITVTKDGSTYKLADTSKNIDLLGGLMTATVAISSSTVKDGKLNMTIKVNNVKQGGNDMQLGDMNIAYLGSK